MLPKFSKIYGFRIPYPIICRLRLPHTDGVKFSVGRSVQLVAVSLLGDEMVTCKNKSVIWSDAVPWCDEWRQSRINSHEPTVCDPFWFSYAYFIACSPLQAPAYLFTAVILLLCVSLGLGLRPRPAVQCGVGGWMFVSDGRFRYFFLVVSYR